MPETWEIVKAKAEKILGKGAKVPDAPDAINKINDDYWASKEEFNSAREDCESKLVDLDNANSAKINIIEQFRATIEKNDFELDEKKDAKIIQQAQKTLLTAVDNAIKRLGQTDKVLNELTKHLIQMGKYKQAAGPF